jgi:hypothetical protein
MISFRPLPELAGPLYGMDPWPLRFHTHGFNAACHNTLACSIIYNRYQFGTRRRGYDGELHDRPSGPPPYANWKDEWGGGHVIALSEGETFPGPVEIEWTSLNCVHHVTSIDLDEIFKDRLILHRVARHEVKEPWLDAKSVHPVHPSIMVEVDDCTINVFMRATVATEAQQIPGNCRSHFRHDLILAWTQTY